MARAAELASQGRLQDAMRALSRLPSAASSVEVLGILRDLHPSSAPPAVLDPAQEPRPLRLRFKLDSPWPQGVAGRHLAQQEQEGPRPL